MNIPVKKFIIVLALITVLLAILSSLGNYLVLGLGLERLAKLADVFNLDSEINIPTWYNSLLFLIAAFLLALIAVHKTHAKDKYGRLWWGLAVIFVLLSLDESSSVHEMIGSYLRQAINGTGFFFFSWVIAGFAFVLVLGAVYARMILSLPRRIRNLFILSAVIFLGGALGVEMLGSKQFYDHGPDNFGFVALFTIEEMMEQFGLIIFIYGLLSYMKDNAITALIKTVK